MVQHRVEVGAVAGKEEADLLNIKDVLGGVS